MYICKVLVTLDILSASRALFMAITGFEWVISRPGRSWNLIVSTGRSWKLKAMFAVD